MAPKKKKKPIANPARGFATTSVPSKPKPSISTESPLETPEAAIGLKASDAMQEESQTAAYNALTSKMSQERTLNAMTADELEQYFQDERIQLLLEQHSAQVKADASRAASRLTTERRQLRSQAEQLATAGWLTEELMNAIMTAPVANCPVSPRVEHGYSKANVDTDALVQLWTLERTLHTLKLPRVDEGLEHVTKMRRTYGLKKSVEYPVGLLEALEWYASGENPDIIPNYDTGGDGLTRELEIGAESNNEEIQDTCPESTPTGHSLEQALNDDVHNEMSDDQHSPNLEFSEPILTMDNEDDPAALTSMYLSLQRAILEIEELEQRTLQMHRQQVAHRKIEIDTKLRSLRSDPLFDARDAEEKWQIDKREHLIKLARTPKQPQDEQSGNSQAAESDHVETSESEDDTFVGKMFDVDEADNLDSNSAAKQSSVHVQDYGPWNGIQPGRLLHETFTKDFASRGMKLSTVSQTSYSARRKLEIFWSRAVTVNNQAKAALPHGIVVSDRHGYWTITMESFATATLSQADALLTTIALFLAELSISSSCKTYIRLPKVWREVYCDLRAKLAEQIRNEDAITLKRLSTLIETSHEKKIGDEQKARSKNSADQTSDRPHGLQQESRRERRSPNEVSELWHSRAARSTFTNMLAQRQKLPICAYKSEILQTIKQSRFVVVCADTGAGKSTQIPSYILENELTHGCDAHILVTQPRRISAISIAKRVSEEIGESKTSVGTRNSLIGYAVRLETRTSENTRLTFATTGVLLRMLEGSPTLDMLDYLILDEVHERTMEMDLLFIALKRLREQRPDLKIILMSATVNAQKFAAYFDDAPVLDIPGRTFPVEVKYLEDAVEETLDIEAPDNRHEAEDLDSPAESEDETQRVVPEGNLSGYSSRTRAKLANFNEIRLDYELICNLVIAIATKPCYRQYSRAILIFMPGIAEIRRLHAMIMSSDVFASGWVAHMLHSSFSTEDLEMVFMAPLRGQRKIVIATNIAETGITIPDVTAVIDTCKEKIMRFDERRQLSRLTEGFVSRSSARQRRGRAARVQEGLCFHLVTRNRFDNLMMEQSTPEMLRLSLQEPILRLKTWGMGMAEETLSAAIDPPAAKNIRRALERLREVDALDGSEQLTALGQLLARLPLDVAMGKISIYGILLGCLEPTLTIIAILSSKSPFIAEKADTRNFPHHAFARGASDLLTSLNAYQGWQKARVAGQAQTYCRTYHLSQHQLQLIQDQKIQLMVYLSDGGLVRLDPTERAALTRARNSRSLNSVYEIPARFSRYANDAMALSVIAIAFYPRLLVRDGKGYRQIYTNQQMKVGPSSVVRQMTKAPKWLCYYEAMQSKGGSMNALELSTVSESVIVLLLGQADFKLFSGVIVVDNGRARFSVKMWKQAAALQRLRSNVAYITNHCFKTPELLISPSDQRWFDLLAQAIGSQS